MTEYYCQEFYGGANKHHYQLCILRLELCFKSQEFSGNVCGGNVFEGKNPEVVRKIFLVRVVFLKKFLNKLKI